MTSSMSALPDVLAANARYAASFAAADAPGKPRLKLAVVTCMDARIDPAALLGLTPGDAQVIRNAGGRADESAIRSLVVSYKLLGTREFVVIHHESCGMLSFTNEELRAALKTDLGADASDVDFWPFSDLDESVRDDMRTLRESPLIPADIAISGFVYDVRTGRLREVR